MSIELIVPEAGESITEVQIGQWLKAEGESVGKDDPVVEIETDKVTLELPAPAAGTITKMIKKPGDSAKVGDIIGYLEEGAPGSAPAKPTSASDTKQEAEPEPTSQTKAASKPAPSTSKGKDNGAEPRVVPAARRLIEKHSLSLANISATGPGGRILKSDVQQYLDQADSTPVESASAGPETPKGQPAKPQATPITRSLGDTSGAGGREEELVPMTPMRRRIAERLVQAQQNAALLTTFNEIDMSAVMGLRAQYKESFEKRYNIKLGFMSFFVKAAVDALKQCPAINAEVRGTDILYKNYYDIGIAIGSGKGLVVPILRNAERMSFADVEQAIADYAVQARENKLKLEDLQGGTFTITNGGIYGSVMSTPIINPPQSGVLGMHAIQKRPVVVDDQVVVRPMMNVALSYDHRLVDGREAVTFLVRVKQAIEDPSRMLMEI